MFSPGIGLEQLVVDFSIVAAHLKKKVEVKFGGCHQVEAVFKFVELSVEMLRPLPHHVLQLDAAVQMSPLTLFILVIALVAAVDQIIQAGVDRNRITKNKVRWRCHMTIKADVLTGRCLCRYACTLRTDEEGSPVVCTNLEGRDLVVRSRIPW